MNDTWKIVDTNFFCRHKIDGKCIYFGKSIHKCIKEKCPLEYTKHVAKRNRPIGQKRY